MSDRPDVTDAIIALIDARIARAFAERDEAEPRKQICTRCHLYFAGECIPCRAGINPPPSSLP